MKDFIELMRGVMIDVMQSGEIIIKKEEGSLDMTVSADNDAPSLLGLMYMEAMLETAKLSEMHKISIMSACEHTLAEIRKEADHEV